MDNQHKHIKGYRDLSVEEIALMNEIKQQGEVLEKLVAKVSQHAVAQAKRASHRSDEEERLVNAQPQRWISIARTDLQTGLMALTRAVAQPTTF